MPEFLTLLPPEEARAILFSHLAVNLPKTETLKTSHALGRVVYADIRAPHPLPQFPRSTVDGYAVRAMDTHGASDSLPAYLELTGEVAMGRAPAFQLESGKCAIVHTGGMLPAGSDAVVMLEHTQTSRKTEIEILKPVADGENVIKVGEDVIEGHPVIPKGTRLRPAEIGGLMALGITALNVVKKIRVALLATGDEIVEPESTPGPGQVRDVNSYTLRALVEKMGGDPVMYGIIPDQLESLKTAAKRALTETDVVVITAGSSASTRDMTADVIRALGDPGVLVHGVNTRPGKPTILGVCNGKAVIGLPGNPVSALVNGYLFLGPLMEKLLGALPRPQAIIPARLTVNLASVAGREDWWPIRLIPPSREQRGYQAYTAEPIFGKSNLIFSLAAADGLVCIPADVTGLSAGETVDVVLI